MTISCALSCVTLAVDGYPIEVEAHVADGLVGMNVTGLADISINEARDRVRAAIVNSGARWPQRRITVGLSPASLPKHGSGLDLAIAMSILSADGQLTIPLSHDVMFVGELSLDGRVRRSRGSLISALTAKQRGCRQIYVSTEDADVVTLIDGIEVIAVNHLTQAIARYGGSVEVVDLDTEVHVRDAVSVDNPLDFNQVRGQHFAKFALEVAAAGGHHCALLGPPGVGKTLLATRLPTILPTLDVDEQLQVAAIASAAGQPPILSPTPPFAAPHHTSSYSSLIGGGSAVPSLGMVTRAHRGVLFLDEAPEFASNVLDALRQPLESGAVLVSRREFNVRLPASFQLVIAANPCPCGHALDISGRCECTPTARKRYLNRISGPLMDRIDMRIIVEKSSLPDLVTDEIPESSEVIRQRVIAARERMHVRYRSTEWTTNADIPGPALRELFPLNAEVHKFMVSKLSQSISARGFDRILKLSWTLADLHQHERPDESDVVQAAALRDAQGSWAA